MSEDPVARAIAAGRAAWPEVAIKDEVVVAHGVTILGPTNLASTVPYHASQMYARNVVTLVQHLVQREKDADGKATGATPGVTLRSGRDTETVTAR